MQESLSFISTSLTGSRFAKISNYHASKDFRGRSIHIVKRNSNQFPSESFVKKYEEAIQKVYFFQKMLENPLTLEQKGVKDVNTLLKVEQNVQEFQLIFKQLENDIFIINHSIQQLEQRSKRIDLILSRKHLYSKKNIKRLEQELYQIQQNLQKNHEERLVVNRKLEMITIHQKLAKTQHPNEVYTLQQQLYHLKKT